MHVDLVVANLAAEPHRMRTENPGNVVAPVIRGVVLIDTRDRHAHHETIEDDVLNTFELRSLYHDARGSGSRQKTLGGDAHARSTMGPPDIVRVSRSAEVQFVDCICS